MAMSSLELLADAVIKAALDVGYDIRPGKRTGDKQRLARDADIDPGQLSRLISAQRMPGIDVIAALCHVINLDPMRLLAQVKAESGTRHTQNQPSEVRSLPLTPDDVADSWGITDPVEREEVRALHRRLRRDTHGADTGGGEQAQAD